MGGLGSGRPGGWGRDKVEEHHFVDVNELHRAGCLRPGYKRGRTWLRDGEKVASISIRVGREQIHLRYSFRTSSGADEWKELVETIRIAWISCRFGGNRPYFICAGETGGSPCGRRVGKLYATGRHYLCRHCCQLTYRSQSEDDCMRLRRKALKAINRLGGDTSTGAFVQRPKGMWNRTFERRRRQAFDLEWDADKAFDLRLAQMEKSIAKKARSMQRPRIEEE